MARAVWVTASMCSCQRSLFIRAAGVEVLMAPTTAPEALKMGAPTPVTPSRNSPLFSA